MTFKIGDRVTYSDMANPPRFGRIVSDRVLTSFEVQHPEIPLAPEFLIAWDDGRESTSDCRQNGWQLVSSPAPKAAADRPEFGKVYSLTGPGASISNGNSWAESEVAE